MDYTIYPFEGLGAIRFGMTPQQVREVIGEPKGTHMSYGSKFPIDDYFNPEGVTSTPVRLSQAGFYTVR
jgi:hypothetical protein